MTLATATRLVSYTGNGVTTEFALGVRVDYETDLKVALQDATTLVMQDPMSSSLYSVTGIGEDAGVTVTYPLSGSPLASTHKIVIYREVPYTQEVGLTNQGRLFLEALETQLDRVVMQTQQLAEQVSRSYVFDPGVTVVDFTAIAEAVSTDADEAAASAAAALVAQLAAEAAQAAAEAAANYVTITGTQTITGYKSFSGFTSTANAAIVDWTPSDYGVGKPMLLFKKGASAKAYSLESWDGVSQDAQFNFVFNQLSLNGYQLGSALHIPNYLSGLTLSNNVTDPTNDIDIAVGACTDTWNVKYLVLQSALTKQSDAAWAVGTNAGWLDTGTIADGSYHAWLIMRSDTGVVDSLLSLSATAPTMPANYDYKRRIGSVIRSGGAIVKFFQFGDKFLLDVPSTALAFTQPAIAALRVLNDIPLGVRVEALIRAMATNGGSAFAATITSPDTADTAPSTTATPLADLAGASGAFDRETFSVMTDASGQVRTDATVAATEMDIVTLGWIDRRGRDG